ncbi:MAG: DUF2341 domain-containing protein [Elusimicrobia bacterium]|nr:DUF2341 domain-containing protein [Elusimicrobiota bacterium]
MRADWYGSSGGASSPTSSGWFDSNWKYRRKITINSSTNTLNNYQVWVPTTSFGSNWSDILSKAQSDMDDFRFVHSSGGTLNYWIDQSTAGFWVKVSTLTGNGNTDVWMYYGNSTASGGSTVSGVWGTGLKGYWTMNEGSGSTAKDYSGEGNTGTLNSITWIEGKFNKCLHFDNGDDSVSLSIPIIAAEKTLEFWIKSNRPLSIDDTWEIGFLGDVAGNGIRFGMMYGVGSCQDLGFWGYGSEYDFSVVSYTNKWSSDSVFHHVTVTMNSSYVCHIYIDGKKVTQYYRNDDAGTFSSMQEEATQAGFIIESRGAFSTYYIDLDEVRVYDKVLTADEIKTHADVGNATVQAVGAEQGKYYSAGNYKANVLDSGADGTKVHQVGWNPLAQSAGTDIDVYVRVSNSSFAASDGTPSWTSVSNGGNPALVGRYIQWMSTFTTTSSTTTPRIEDITLTYTSPPPAPAVNYNAGDSYTQVTWKWADNSSGQYQEDGFRVYSSTGGILKILSADTTCWTEAGLKRNTKYSRYVQSYNTAGSNNSATVNKKTQPCVWQEKATTRTGPNAFGFEGDGIWTWKVPVNGGSLVTITAYAQYNSDYGSADKPKITLYNYGVNSTAQMTGAADTWEPLTVSGTPSGKGVLFLKVEGFSTAVGAKYFVDDIQVSQ